MISYAKIWTATLHDEWFLGLSLTERGLFLQLIILAKESGDFGSIFARNFTSLGSILGCDGRTCSKILAKFLADKKVIFQENVNGTVKITLLKYQYWQGLKNGKELKKEQGKLPEVGKNVANMLPNDNINDKRSINDNTNDKIIDNKKDILSVSEKTDPIPFEEIIEHLNELTGKSFNPHTETTKKLIRARWAEGFRLQDFLDVNTGRTRKWLNDPKYCEYLRPLTIYGTKFESYLNDFKISHITPVDRIETLSSEDIENIR
jgi:uncharacterized phage protein (TIGR02220 family)